MMPIRMTTCLALLVMLLTGQGVARAAESPQAKWTRVAYDDAGVPGEQPHLTSSGRSIYRIQNERDEVLATVSLGTRGRPYQHLRFSYEGLNPNAKYKAIFRFVTDTLREVSIKAGDTVVVQSIPLAIGKVEQSEVELPAAAFSAGKLELLIEPVSTDPKASAVVSDVAIFSTDPKPLPADPNPAKNPALVAGRLSPQPIAVTNVANPVLSLNGTWRFNGTADIQVPGEWVMQGFNVPSGQAAHYERKFSLPKDWNGQRIKLRCDAVFSDATVSINGREAGKHLGGFTPFELDVTDLVKSGEENVVQLAVISESVADRLASASSYAAHSLGGITRGIRMFALPPANLAGLHVATTFDKEYCNANLELDLEMDGQSTVLLALTSPDGQNVPLNPNRIGPGHTSIPVARPAKWDTEHPNLYTLTVQVEQDGKRVETVRQRVGFRQIEARGNRIFVNNQPVKLRGINHHEAHPLAGRSVPAGLDRRDVELFRAGNVNLLRTSHYPPSEELLEAADELGMFIECEAPICWGPYLGNQMLVSRQTAEMAIAYRNHPSILFWSLANESVWGNDFAVSSSVLRQLDPTRPQNFNGWGDGGCLEISNLHYPGHGGVASARNSRKPIYHGEDCHLNSINCRELAADPGLRDRWGAYLRDLWDDMYVTPGSLGLSIWSGIDEVFYLPDGQMVGWGAWGPLDGWRREKPEYWNMKKGYSPVRVGAPSVSGRTISMEVENRQLFSNLNEMKIDWKLGDQSGTASADIAAGQKGIWRIELSAIPQPGEALAITFTDPRGFMADMFKLVLPGKPSEKVKAPIQKVDWQIDRKTGQLKSINGLAVGGPELMVLPLTKNGGSPMKCPARMIFEPYTATCAGWVYSKASTQGAVTTVEGRYDGAEGFYKFRSLPEGYLEIAYEFTIGKAVDPRQIGLVFTLPRECEVFSWERQGLWDIYPEDHIGRLKGTVKASEGFEATSTGPRTQPLHPWRLDKLPQGNNDFCSTKHNVISASLVDSAGRGLAIDGQGQQHVRCWRAEDAVHVLIAEYSNGGSNGWLAVLANKDKRPLKPGDKISGTVRIGTVCNQ